MSNFYKGMRVLPSFHPIYPIGARGEKDTQGLIGERSTPLTVKHVRPLDDEVHALTFREKPRFEYESCYFKEVQQKVATAPS